MVKRESLVIFRMLGAEMTPSSGGFLETDLVFPGNYPNVVVWKDLWKDLRHGSALGDKIPMKGTLPRSNGKVKNAFHYKIPGRLVSLISHKPKNVYTRITQNREDSL